LTGCTSVLTPFPGTPVWDDAKARGLVSDDMDWESLQLSLEREKNKAIIVSENLTRDELYELLLMFEKRINRREEPKIFKRRTIIKRALINPWIIPRVLLSAFKARVLLGA